MRLNLAITVIRYPPPPRPHNTHPETLGCGIRIFQGLTAGLWDVSLWNKVQAMTVSSSVEVAGCGTHGPRADIATSGFGEIRAKIKGKHTGVPGLN